MSGVHRACQTFVSEMDEFTGRYSVNYGRQAEEDRADSRLLQRTRRLSVAPRVQLADSAPTVGPQLAMRQKTLSNKGRTSFS